MIMSDMTEIEREELISTAKAAINGDPIAWFDELYDLEADPNEETNLIKQVSNQPIYEKLDNLIHSWMISIDDPLLSSSFKQ